MEGVAAVGSSAGPHDVSGNHPVTDCDRDGAQKRVAGPNSPTVPDRNRHVLDHPTGEGHGAAENRGNGCSDGHREINPPVPTEPGSRSK